MVRNIVQGEKYFSKASKALKEDINIAIDLLDTLKANKERCVGMAANMIGLNKAIIAFNMGPFFIAMLNPKITKQSKSYKTSEGCLSLIGERECIRYEEIEVEFEDLNFKKQKQKFTGFTAEIIQHECDHLNGIII